MYALRRLGLAALAAGILLLASATTARAASALVDLAQGASDPAAGIALIGATGTSVSIGNGGDATGVQSWQVALLYTPNGSGLSVATIAFSNNGATPVAAFTPDVTGCYRIQLQVWTVLSRSGAATDTDIRNFCVPEAGGQGFVIPPYQGLPARTLGKPDELNFGNQPNGYSGRGTSADGLSIYQMRTTAAQLPTIAEKQAIQGTSGTPGPLNPFVTDGDGRNSNARTPSAHALTHMSGGSDPIALDTLATPTDITTLNVSTGAHGLVKKLSGSATDCYLGSGSFVSCLTAIAATAPGIALLQGATVKIQAANWKARIAVQGGTIPDADYTANVSSGSVWEMPTVTANRVVTFGVSGSPVSGAEVMRVDVTRSSAFTVTFKDDAGTTLTVCPASVPCSVIVKHDATTGHFANPSLIRIL